MATLDLPETRGKQNLSTKYKNNTNTTDTYIYKQRYEPKLRRRIQNTGNIKQKREISMASPGPRGPTKFLRK